MYKPSVSKAVLSVLIAFVLVGCGNDTPSEKNTNTAVATSAPAEDVVASVGDEQITFSQINTMLNSSAIVGLSIPALGTPERSKVMLTLLDKVISANLVYLDAKQKGVDRLTAYEDDLRRFEDAIIASLYRTKIMIGDIPVSEAEVLDFYNNDTDKADELTDDVKFAIEAKVRDDKLKQLKASLRERLRKDTKVVIYENILSPDYDDKRTDADTVASFDDQRVTWSQVKDLMKGADKRATLASFYIDNDEERLQRLNTYVDNAIMAKKGREAGLDKDPVYARRTAEYRKTRLINEHRERLIASWKPSEDELKTYYVANMDRLVVPEARKIQMVVVKTKDEAESIKAQIDKGEITMFQAAQQYSIDPNAKRTLGDMGWVSHGSGFKALDDFTFNLEPEVLGGPVESPSGWHLVKVLDVHDAQFENFDDAQTQRRTYRAYIQDRFNDYVVELRKNHFKVAVYNDELNRQFQHQADFIAALSLKSQEKGSVTEQRMQDLQKWITPPPK